MLRGARRVRLLYCCGISFMLGLFALGASAQATTTADRFATISAFGTGSRIYTDYGQDNFGFAVGGDFTRNFHLVAPSLELRYTHSNGKAVNEDTFATGLKLEKGFHRFRPSADLEIGHGTIRFINGPPYYNHDDSIVYALGFGLEYTIDEKFSLKLDSQYQYWNLGQTSTPIEPYNLGIGIVYHTPVGGDRLR